jgi:lipopolysaccharide/colanic/teichoic acid biosynthesis glycosyltransferase
VSGRSKIGGHERMWLDEEYVDRWSPLLDVKLLARTVPAVLTARGAH